MVRIPNSAVSGSGAQYGPGSLLVGNDHSSDYGPQTGSPAGNVLPIRFQQVIGTPGVTVKQTTQAFAGWAKYKERTVDDSAEAASWGIILTDAYGGFASAQTLPVVGFEADALIQGAVSVTNKVIGATANVQIQNTAHADSTMNFYSAQTNVVGTVTNRYAFYDEGTTGAGTITNSWSFYGKKDVQTEARLYVGIAGVPATQTQRVLLVGSSADSTGTLGVQMGSGQSAASIQVRDSGGVQHGQWFGNTGNLLIGTSATAGSGNAILSICTTTNPSGTPPAAGMYLYTDTTDNNPKVKFHSGDVRTIWHGGEQELLKGAGLLSWNLHPNTTSGSTAPTQGVVYATAVGYRAGQVVTNTCWLVGTAAVGTPPTHIFTGICDKTGTMVAQSNDDAANTDWKQNVHYAQSPLSATYTVPSDGIYYHVLLQVGAWGTTQMTLGKAVGNNTPGGLSGSQPIFGTGGTTGQSALPATSSALVGGLGVTNTPISYWTGAS